MWNVAHFSHSSNVYHYHDIDNESIFSLLCNFTLKLSRIYTLFQLVLMKICCLAQWKGRAWISSSEYLPTMCGKLIKFPPPHLQKAHIRFLGVNEEVCTDAMQRSNVRSDATKSDIHRKKSPLNKISQRRKTATTEKKETRHTLIISSNTVFIC